MTGAGGSTGRTRPHGVVGRDVLPHVLPPSSTPPADLPGQHDRRHDRHARPTPPRRHPPAAGAAGPPTAGQGLGARELVEAVRRGVLDARAVADGAIERARRASGLNAFVSLAGDDELPAPPGDGAAADRPLAGLPLAVKDVIDVAGLPCTGGTPALREWRPRRDAPIVARLRRAGAVVVGKANLHELSVGITSNNPTFGPVRNPHDPAMIAGGSSGGSAAAVAAGVVPVALGADTAGSNRIPAALCGCVGFRPTVGRYPGGGVIPLSATRDTVGLFARTVGDARAVDDVITGRPGRATRLAGRRLGVPRPYFYDDLDDDVRSVTEQALARLAHAGATLVAVEVGGGEGPPLRELVAPLSLPLTFYEWPRALGAYLAAERCPVTTWEVADAMAGPTERGWLAEQLWGDGVTHERYLDIVAHGRPRLIAAYRACFARHRLDALVLPTTPLPARPVGQDDTVDLAGRPVRTLDAYLRNGDPSSVAGLPSISVPAGVTGAGLPVGLSFDGLPGADATVLALADAFEREAAA